MTSLHTETLFDETETMNSKQIFVLKKHFPQCFDKHGHFQPEKMMEVVKANEVEIVKESYSLNWLGKSYARLLTNLPPQGLLKPDTEHNSAPQNSESENLLIKGDNLEVLKHLVNGYREQIKMIYIDPPYNTGSDGFVYQDSFKFSVDDLSRLAGIDKAEAERILSFNAKGSNSHSAWLTFMYPRLYIARELLKEDGVIFISIDDNEQSQLKLVCDEVFGEENFIANTVRVSNSMKNNASHLSITHDYTVVYAKQKNATSKDWKIRKRNIDDFVKIVNRLKKQGISNSEIESELKALVKYPKYYDFDHYYYCDDRGVYRTDNSGGVDNGNFESDILHPVTNKPCKKPAKGWRYNQKTIDKMLDENMFHFGTDERTIPLPKRYLNDYTHTVPIGVGFYDTQIDTNFFKSNSIYFDFPKPKDYIVSLLEMVTSDQDIILDFFAGSATTAHAVMQLNSDNSENRKYICIQLDEPTDPKKPAYKAGFKSVFDITKDRIEKSAISIANEKPSFEGDLGFKVYETANDFRPKIDDDFEVANESLFDDMVLSDEQYQALLTTWMLYDNNHLTQQIEDIDLQGYKAHLVDKGLYLINSDFRTDNLKQLLDKLDTDKNFGPNRIIVNGYNFDTAMQMELNEAIKSYQNKKSISINIIVRY